MIELRDPVALANIVASRIARDRPLLVGVEGHSTAGKSCLAKQLVDALPGSMLISTDEFALPNSTAPNYPDRLDLRALAARLEQRGGSPVFVIEGICLRDTLERVKAVPDLFVYCKRITESGLWAGDLANYVHAGQPVDGLSWVDDQSVRYHIRARPEVCSDFTFVWKRNFD